MWLRRREVLGDRDPTQPGWAGTVSLVLVVLLVVVSLFWATTNYAREYGRGRADQYARQLAVRPGVIVYSADRLFLNGPGVVETTRVKEALVITKGTQVKASELLGVNLATIRT